ncbi:hypothetical protein N7486_002192 [Penicillium sp. IBT 16267x]|nr:hypothetical protein N7486_002192 [Penicillium sp. IBT 16267x]
MKTAPLSKAQKSASSPVASTCGLQMTPQPNSADSSAHKNASRQCAPSQMSVPLSTLYSIQVYQRIIGPWS